MRLRASGNRRVQSYRTRSGSASGNPGMPRPVVVNSELPDICDTTVQQDVLLGPLRGPRRNVLTPKQRLGSTAANDGQRGTRGDPNSRLETTVRRVYR